MEREPRNTSMVFGDPAPHVEGNEDHNEQPNPEIEKGTLTVTSPLPILTSKTKRRNTFNKQPRPQTIENQKTASASPIENKNLPTVEEESFYPYQELSERPVQMMRRPTIQYKVQYQGQKK
jgi:hypothetical protein